MHTIDLIQNRVKQAIENYNFISEPRELYEPVDYTLSLGGKRLRPVLCLLACDMFGGDIEKAFMPAIGIEIFHNFTLIHDDIMDNASIRRGKETVYKKWNTNIAILSGDAAFVMAYKFIVKTDKDKLSGVLECFNKTALEVCEGQQYDMNYETTENVSIDDYIKMIRLKTAVLLGASLKIGAITGDASPDDIEKIYRFGENIGIAFQLMDDILDVFSDEKKFGKKTGGDIVENKKTYLYLKAFELAKAQDYDNLKYAFSMKDNDKKVEAVKNIYLKLKVKESAEKEINNYYDKALAFMEGISVESSRKKELKTFT